MVHFKAGKSCSDGNAHTSLCSRICCNQEKALFFFSEIWVFPVTDGGKKSVLGSAIKTAHKYVVVLIF